MTPNQHTELDDLNREINQIPYVEVAGAEEVPDWWGDHPQQGHTWVCRDYVLMKARFLRDAGYEPSALAVIFCWTEPFGNPQTREYHAVLSVVVDGERWILDSREDPIYRFENPPPNLYIWDRVQVAGTDEFEPVSPTTA